MLSILDNDTGHEQHGFKAELDALILEGARKMLLAAIEAEVADYIERHKHHVDEDGRRLVVRNGKAKPGTITTAGTMEVEAPRVNDKRVIDGERQKFTSAILLLSCGSRRKSPKVAEVLPILYLRGLSTNDSQPALESLLGDRASGLSATAITRLTAQWEAEHKAWKEQDYRESTDSWASLLRSLCKRGMRSPVVAVGMERSASGRRCATCGPRPRSSAAGFTRWATCSTSCPSASSPSASLDLGARPPHLSQNYPHNIVPSYLLDNRTNHRLVGQ